MYQFELQTGQLEFKRMLYRAPLPIRSIDVSPDGSLIAVGSEYVNLLTSAIPK